MISTYKQPTPTEHMLQFIYRCSAENISASESLPKWRENRKPGFCSVGIDSWLNASRAAGISAAMEPGDGGFDR